MISIRKNRYLRVKRTIACFLVFSLIVCSAGIYLDYHLRTVVLKFAKSAAKTVIINCANKAADDVLAELNITYDSLAKISRNSEGLATSVEIDSVAANKFKAEITNAIAKELAKHETVQFTIPVTAAFGWYRSSFQFPKFSYTVHITTTVGSNFKSNFQSAGINQVLHQILMTITLESGVAMTNKDTELSTVTEFIVAQTVIVGAVPDAFTSVGHATDEVMEDIFDFGASASN